MAIPTRLAPKRPKPMTVVKPPPGQGQPPAMTMPNQTARPSGGLGAALRPPAPAAAAPPPSGTGLGVQPTANDPMYTGREDDVSVLVNDMAKQDSLLMQQAATSGLQTANDRGMANSSMSAGASQAATLDYITPIASQNATQSFNKNMSGLQTQQDLVLAEFDRDTQQKLQRTQLRADSRQAGLDRNFQTETMQAEQAFSAGQTAAQQAFEAEQLAAQQSFQSGEAQSDRDFVQEQMDFEAQQTQDARDFQAAQADLDRQMQAALAEMELSDADQTAANAMMTDAFGDYNQMYAQILANPDLSADERISQINTNQQMLEDRIGFTQDLYDATFDWPASPWTQGSRDRARPAPSSPFGDGGSRPSGLGTAFAT